MSIAFKQTIIHNLDLNMGQPLLSKECVVLTDEAESFITRKIYQVLENQGVCEAKFKEQMSLFPEDHPASIFKNWNGNSLKHLSEVLANGFYRYMAEYDNIPNGDLIMANYLVDSEEYVAILKVNFNDGDYTHYFSSDDETMKLVVNKGIYHKRINEGVIIKLSDTSVQLLDESKSKYISLMLDLETKLSAKETLRALDKVAKSVIEDHYANPVKAIAELENNISESIARTQNIPIQEVIEKTFGEDEEVLNHVQSKLEEYGISNESNVEVTSSRVANKYNKQKLKTDTGIEIRIPTHLMKDTDFFEIINEANGTQSLIVKNVSQVVSK